jgi:hypothetical protein
MSTKSKTSAKSAPVVTFKTKKPWKDGGVREVATTTCKSGATAAAVAKALSKEREKSYGEKTTLGILNWLAAKGFLERVSG